MFLWQLSCGCTNNRIWVFRQNKWTVLKHTKWIFENFRIPGCGYSTTIFVFSFSSTHSTVVQCLKIPTVLYIAMFKQNHSTVVQCLTTTTTKTTPGHAISLRPLASKLKIRAATILRLLGNETIQFSTRSKKSEPAIQKQLNIDVKSTTKLNFFL